MDSTLQTHGYRYWTLNGVVQSWVWILFGASWLAVPKDSLR
jgi:hypothetical protein